MVLSLAPLSKRMANLQTGWTKSASLLSRQQSEGKTIRPLLEGTTKRRDGLGVRPSSGAASFACSIALDSCPRFHFVACSARPRAQQVSPAPLRWIPAPFPFLVCCARGRAHSGGALKL